VKVSCERGSDDEAASSDVGVPVEPVEGGGRVGDDMALATVCIPGEFELYMVGGLGGRCGLCVRVYWGKFFLGPLELQGERSITFV
jgi:hypothetical protein